MTSGELTRTEAIAEMVGEVFTTADYYEVGREKVREFARALHDDNPFHWDEAKAAEGGHPALLAPLTMVAIMGTKSQAQLLEAHIPGNLLKSGVLQVDQSFTFHKPIMAGDKLYCDVNLETYRTVAGADLFTVKTLVRDVDRGVLQESWTSLAGPGEEAGRLPDDFDDIVDRVIFSGADSHVQPLVPSSRAEIPAPEGGPWTTIAFDELTEGMDLPVRRQQFTRGDVINYIGVSGDPNPIHHSDAVAHAAGLDTVVAQAMLTLGTAAGYLTSFVGDPAAFRNMSARFTSPVYIPANEPAVVEYSAKVKSLDPATKTAMITFGASLNGKRVFGRCTANVQFA
ncbi:fused (3R)-hydroxyacyl-ACP dehydratase subunits HadA/HadB [Gordonia hydrophobica]|uniref:Fused (3R)-hydroxyacyl-ACP dehydratase subunits HadA/HadB n=1 Tax=Gordonia hydrophobica TaxID=40516 RepID=A0ABZ2U5G2_9ACTN|nr:fused (3R)-hydroxyacyl-ACP dehydratase subunits HadA/HadB [Gordonia hydrophobica]MBM7368232.1 acyl dehydratase [Gordonia hydrophobica]